MQLQITEHAQQKMEERDLGIPHILAAIISGTSAPVGDGRSLHQCEEVRVIAIRHQRQTFVITAYREQDERQERTRDPLARTATKREARRNRFRDPRLKQRLKAGHIRCLWPDVA